MEIYETEEQQVEAIKKFWHEYGNQIIAGIVIGLGGFYGLNYYKDSQREAAAEAAQAYAKAEQVEQLKTFATDYASSGYAGLADLKIAKTQVEAGELEKAAATLNTAIAAGNLPTGVAEIARLRLVRVNIELNQLDAAIAELKGDWSEALNSEVQALLGDALVQKGELDAAREAYQNALNSAEPGAANNLIQMRLNDLTKASATETEQAVAESH